MSSGQDNLYILSHNVETGEINQLSTTEEELNRVIEPELLARQAELSDKQQLRLAIYEKLGITAEEAALLLA